MIGIPIDANHFRPPQQVCLENIFQVIIVFFRNGLEMHVTHVVIKQAMTFFRVVKKTRSGIVQEFTPMVSSDDRQHISDDSVMCTREIT